MPTRGVAIAIGISLDGLLLVCAILIAASLV
jgi:hypothetical protein